MLALGASLIFLGALVSLLNWCTLVASYRSGRFVSVVPLVGATLLGSGMLIIPQTRSFAWLAPVFDFGTLALLIAIPWLLREAWQTSTVNLVHEFHGSAAGREIRIRLFRSQRAIISAVFNAPVPCDDWGARAASFSLTGKWSQTEDGFSITGCGSGRELVLSRNGDHYRSLELLHDPAERKYPYDCLDGITLYSHK